MKKIERRRKIAEIESSLEVTFPPSYRRFLLEEGSTVVDGYQVFGLPEAEGTKEERGVLLSFQPGDPKRGGFRWITTYKGRTVGLCSRQSCRFCNLVLLFTTQKVVFLLTKYFLFRE